MAEEFPSNTNRQRQTAAEPEKRTEKIVSGVVTTRRKPLGKRLRETFFSGDAQTVRSYIWDDVVVPNIKDTIADMTIGVVERAMFGASRSRSRRGSSSGSGNYVPYDRYAKPSQRDEPRREMSRRGRSQHNFDEIIIPSRVEAEEVLDKLYELLSRYNEVKVSDLYDACDITWQYTDNKWGWTSLQGSSVERLRSGGYILDLPQPQPLK